MSKPKFQKGMVFGVFDGLHQGHQFFLNEAAGQVEELVVIVTRPEIVKLLKNKEPKNSLEKRVEKIHAFDPKLSVFPGDVKLGDWKVLKEFQPDIVFLGHDQQAIANELEKMGISYSHLPRWTIES